MLEKEAAKILDSLISKKLEDVKDAKVKDYLKNVWGDLYTELPTLAKVLTGAGEVILSGKHLKESLEIMKKLKEDVLAMKKGEIDAAEFKDLVLRRRAALFALYNAQRVTDGRPSVQKVLAAAEYVAGILLKHGLPYLLALL